MKRELGNLAFVVAVAIVGFMLMSSAACPENQVLCLAKE
jgi:hypothetical protein